MLTPRYDLNKIIYSTSEDTYKKASALYSSGKVKSFSEHWNGFTAIVIGTHNYNVNISAKSLNQGSCDCYMGNHDYICKHMVALAIYVVLRGEPIPENTTKETPVFSGRVGELNPGEIIAYKEDLKVAMRYIKGYSGPSRAWFAYQDSLSEGTKRLATIVSYLPASPQTTQLLIKILLRLDKKLSTGGVDDSDGTVSSFIESCVDLLLIFVTKDLACAKPIAKLRSIKTSFDWEKRLLSSQSKENR